MTCEKLLEILENNRGEFVSGKAIADDMKLSRNAVWKAVSELRSLGHNITAVTNKGYRLEADSPIITAYTVKKHLKNENINIIMFESCPSTNAVAHEYAKSGAADMTVVIANSQSAGRGRMGRSFYSPGNTGLYMSFVLRPSIEAKCALEITTASAVAAARVISRESAGDVKIKWVNDIYIDMKKACGILTEASMDIENGYLSFAVLGIGVNLFPPEGGFPAEISNTATSIYSCGYDCEKKARLAAALIDEFASLYPHIGKGSFVDEYRKFSLMPGKEIYVLSGDSRIPATALAIEDDYSLTVRYSDGSIGKLSSGDVSIKVR